MLILRSTLFNFFFFIVTLFFSTLLVASRPFGFAAAWFWGKGWSKSTIGLARIICGIRLEIEGRSHLPDIPCVVLAKHQSAFEQVLEQGRHFLAKDRWVVIFPEGTRTDPGQTGDYQASGIMLARKAGVGILPMAHNAGNCWPKRGFIKHPGTVRVRFLPYITQEEVAAISRNELLARLKADIETATRELGG